MDHYYDMNNSNNSNKGTVPQHDVVMRGRRTLEISGVKQVESFDNEEFLMETVMGFLVIRGENLQMKNLDVDKGVVAIKGKVSGFSYIDEHHGEKAKGFFGKLFK